MFSSLKVALVENICPDFAVLHQHMGGCRRSMKVLCEQCMSSCYHLPEVNESTK